MELNQIQYDDKINHIYIENYKNQLRFLLPSQLKIHQYSIRLTYMAKVIKKFLLDFK